MDFALEDEPPVGQASRRGRAAAERERESERAREREREARQRGAGERGRESERARERERERGAPVDPLQHTAHTLPAPSLSHMQAQPQQVHTRARRQATKEKREGVRGGGGHALGGAGGRGRGKRFEDCAGESKERVVESEPSSDNGQALFEDLTTDLFLHHNL